MVDRSVAVRLQADVAQFEQAMGRAAAATGKVGQEAQRSGSTIGTAMSAGVRGLANLTGVAAAATAGLGTAVWAVGSNYNTLEQQSRAALTTILGSEEAANRMMSQVAEFATTSPFPRQAFIEGTQQLLAFGMEAENVIPTLSAIQDGVAAAGGSSQQITEIVNVLAQVQSTGKFTAETLNQLGYRGIDAAKLIGQEFGITAAEVRESITDGTLDAQAALDALTGQMTATFGGAAENVKNTWIGATDRIRGAFRDISSIIVEPFITKGGGGIALDWANGVADAMRAAQPHIETVVGLLTDRFEPAMTGITDGLQGTAESIRNWDLSNVNGQIDTLVEYAPLIAGVTGALVGMSTQSLPVLGSLGLAINPFVAGIGAMVAASPELRSMLGDFFKDLQPLVPVLGGVAASLLDSGTQILEALIPGLTALLDALAPVVVELGTGFGGAAVVAADALVPVAEVVSDLLGVVGQIPTPLFTAAAGLAAIKAATSGLGLAAVATGARNMVGGLRDSQRLLGTTATAMGVANTAAGKLATGARLMWTAIGGPVGLGLTVAIGLVSKWAGDNRDAAEYVQSHTDAIREQGGAIGELNAQRVVQKLEEDGVLERLQREGVDIATVTEAILSDKDARADRVGTLRDEAERLREQAEAHSEMYVVEEGLRKGYTATGEELLKKARAAEEAARAVEANGGVIDEAVAQYEREEAALSGVNAALGLNKEQLDSIVGVTDAVALGVSDYVTAALAADGAADGMVDDLAAAEEAAEEAAKAFDEFVKSIQDLGSAFSGVRGSAAGFYESLATAQERVQDKDFRRTLDLTTEAGRANNDVIDGIASSTLGYAAAAAEAGGGAGELRQIMQEGRAEFVETAMQMGATREEAERLADGYGLVPDNIETLVSLSGTDQVKTDLNGVTDYAGTLEAIISGDLDPRAIDDELGKALFRINSSEGTADIDGNPRPALGVLDDTLLRIARSAEDVTIDGDSRRGQGVLADMRTQIRRSAEDVTIDGDPGRARSVLADTLSRIDRSSATVDIKGNTSWLQDSFDGWFRRNAGRSISVNVGGRTSNTALATGGIMPGYSPGVDNLHFRGPSGTLALSGGEAVMRPEWTRAVGPEFVHRMNAAARAGGVSGVRQAMGGMTLAHANGGIIPATANLRADSSLTTALGSMLSTVGQKLAASMFAGPNGPGGNGGPPGGSWRFLWSFIRNNFPGAVMTSNFRPGARTLSGYPSRHGMGLAVDWVTPNMRRDAARMYALMGNRLAEHYHTPWGFTRNGRSVSVAGVTRATHWDHIHSAFRNGGIFNALANPKKADTGKVSLNPGMNVVYNGLGRMEHLAEKWAAADRVQYMSAAGGSGVGSAAATPPNFEAIAAAAGAAAARETVAQLARTPITAGVRWGESEAMRSASMAERGQMNNPMGGRG